MALKSFVAAIVVASSVLLGSNAPSAAQAYPARGVRILIAFPPGGTIDTLGRILAQKLSEMWGQSVVVENRAGGGGNIGAIAAAQAAPDGYTLHFGAQSLAVNVTLLPNGGLDPVKDFEPIMLVATSQDVLVVPPNSPFKSVRELIDYAKANPRKLTYGTLGSATSGHLAMALFAELTGGLKLQQVPYTQSSQITTDVMSGRIDVFLPTTGGHIGNVTAGRERALAVSGRTRAEQLPDVPTFQELGIKFDEGTSWYAMFGPKGTPKEIVEKINKDIAAVLAMPDVKQQAVTLGFIIIGGGPEKLRGFLKDEIVKWAEISKTPSFTGQ